MSQLRKVFHVTPNFNAQRILTVGVDPQMSRGARRVAYYVDAETLPWAAALVSMRWATPVGNLSVCECNVPYVQLFKTRWQGVYTCAALMKPTFVSSITNFIGETL